jgi:hypothetical protein
MLENAPDFAGCLDGSRMFLVKLGGVPVDLGQSKNLFGQLGKRLDARILLFSPARYAGERDGLQPCAAVARWLAARPRETHPAERLPDTRRRPEPSIFTAK